MILYALTFAGLAIAVFDSLAESVAPRRILLPLLLPLIVFTIWSNRRFLHVLHPGRAPEPPPPVDFGDFLESDDAKDLIEQLPRTLEKYTPEVRSFFASTLLFPRECLVRALEEADIKAHILQLRVSLTFDTTLRSSDVEASAEASASTIHTEVEGKTESGKEDDDAATTTGSSPALIVPIMRTKKGALQDALDVENFSNASLPTLSQSETKALIGYAIADLFWKAYVDPTGPLNLKELEDRFSDREAALGLILAAVYHREPIDDDKLYMLNWVLRQYKPANQERASYLLRTIKFLARHYIIAVEVPRPTGNHLIVKYRKSLPLHAQIKTLKDKWRIYLSLRPYRLSIPLWLPFFSTSYHFRIMGPPGQYVEDHYLFRRHGSDADTLITQDYLEELSSASMGRIGSIDQGSRVHPYLRVRSPRGLPYAHLYTRDFRFAEPFNLRTVVEFAEMPPGALGGASLVALVSAILVVTFTLLGPPNSNLSALILAAPAIAASWMGVAADNESLLRTSLTTRVGLLVSGLLSFLGGLLYVIQARGKWLGPIPNVLLFSGHVHLRNMDTRWLALSGVASFTAAYLVGTSVVRARRYMRDVRRGSRIDISDILDDTVKETQ